MKVFVITLFITLATFIVKAQSIVGTWQLVDQTTCLENEMPSDDNETASLEEDLKNMSSGTPRVIRFKENQSGEESVHIVDSRKSSKMNNFLYKVDGNNLYILDKKSRLLLGSYEIEKLTADSLVFSNAARACETRILIRTSDSK